MGMTMTQKILAAHAGLDFVEAGQLIEANLDLVLGNDITSPVAINEMKKFENQKLSLSNGIELIVPNNVYQDAESVEFIQNDNGTYSILIKNIEDIQSK